MVVKRISLTMLRAEEKTHIGGFSEPSKMPWLSYSIPPELCKVGSRLRKVKGSTCHNCYAFKGNYAWPAVKQVLQHRYSFLSDLPRWEDEMVAHIVERAARFFPSHDDPFPAFRWFDAGDLQSYEHLDAITNIAIRTQHTPVAPTVKGRARYSDVRYWLPTREHGIVREYLDIWGEFPRNLVVRLSAHMIDGPVPSGDLPVSSVHTDEASYPGASFCPAYKQGGQCRACRTCWDGAVHHVSYPKH